MWEGYTLIAPHLSLSIFSDVHVRLFPLHFVTFHFYLYTTLIKLYCIGSTFLFFRISGVSPQVLSLQMYIKIAGWKHTLWLLASEQVETHYYWKSLIFPPPRQQLSYKWSRKSLAYSNLGGMHYANDQISQTHTHSCEDSSSLKHQSEGLLNPTRNSLTGKYRGKKQWSFRIRRYMRLNCTLLLPGT